jgi:PAS domain S-box-containing protein
MRITSPPASPSPPGSPASAGTGRSRAALLSLVGTLLLVGFARLSPALDPSTPIAQYRARTWKQHDGLPQNSAVAIAQDASGYLWVATFGGLARFDGREFTSFRSTTHPGLPTDRTIALLPDRHGGIWIGMENGGAALFEKGLFHPCPGFPELRSVHVDSIVPGGLEQIFLGTANGVFELRGGRLARHWGVEEGLPAGQVSSLLHESDGTLWIGTTDGLARLRGARVEAVPPGLPPKIHVTTILRRRDGSLWIGTEGGIYRLDRDRFVEVALPSALPNRASERLFEDRNGNLWIGYRGFGLARLRGATAERYTTANGLPSDVVLSLFEDREGSLWIGTDGGGLHQLTDSRVLAYGSPRIPLSAPVRCVVEDGTGGYWIGTRGQPFRGLAHLTKEGLSYLGDPKFEGIPGVLSFFRSEDGTVWIGCEEIGLVLLKNGSVVSGPLLPEGSRDVLSFARAPRGTLLVGTSSGLFEVDSEKGPPRPVRGTESLGVQTILVAGDSTWLGTTSGLVELSDGTTKRWSEENGLASRNVRALFRDRAGTLWIGTYGAGLFRLAGERLDRIGPESGLAANTISFLAEGTRGELWITDNDGIFGVPRQQLDAWVQNPRSGLEVTHLTEEDGMLVRECNGGSQPAGLVDSGGNLVAATINGIVLVRADRSLKNPLPPPVFIQSLRVEGRELALDAEPALASSAREIEIRYAALSFIDSGGVRFRIRLEGSDPDWLDVGNRAQAHYTRLPAGRYRFRVVACNASGVWNEEGASLAFRVLPSFFESWWFLGLIALALALVVVTVFRLRTEVLRRRGRELERVVADRTAELEEARSGLERKVEERTAAVVSARALLEEQLAKTWAAHDALEASEERFRSVFDNAPIGIFRSSRDGTLLMANLALASMLGIDDPSELAGTNLCLHRCLRGQQQGSCLPDRDGDSSPWVHEAEWRRRDGQPLWVRVHMKLAEAPGNSGTAHIEGTVEDITEIRKAREMLSTLETAIVTMDLGITITDLENRVLYANPAEARMHGFGLDELLGRDARELGPETQRHELDRRELKEPWIFRREVLNRRADGSLFPVHLTSIPVMGGEGTPLCFVTLCQDLTESKKRDSQLQEALREAVVGKLAAVVAHQVNTPLAAMKTRLEMLREDAGENEAAQRNLDSLMKQVDKVAQTVRSLLGFVRQRNVGEGLTSLQDVVTSVSRLFEEAFRGKGIRVDVSLPAEPLHVQGSTADLQEVFLNLFENFREALGRGNRVSISTRTTEGSVEIRLEDDGPGLGPDPERVFEPFFTTKSHGTGLGLAICRNICIACGGSLIGESRQADEGQGARFVIRLPLAQAGPHREEPS